MYLEKQAKQASLQIELVAKFAFQINGYFCIENTFQGPIDLLSSFRICVFAMSFIMVWLRMA